MASKSKFEFIDLFAGIGGMRLAFESVGGKCVWTSEWDKFAQLTYRANHGDNEVHGDITAINAKDIPDHDVLIAGFPCQPFSSAGVSKKNSMGRKHGFEDETQGTLFFDVARIIKEKQPKAFFLENVKNLLSHDKGNTFMVIRRTLEDLGYDIHYQIVDAAHFVPQKRQRIFIVGFRSPQKFEFPAMPDASPKLKTILDKKVDPKYTLSDKLWAFLQGYAAKHAAKGNGFGCTVNGPNDVGRTLSARYGKDGSEILIAQKGKNPRRLTPRECARIMGMPDDFKIVCSDTRAYKQFGNAVVVPAIAHVAKAIVPFLKKVK